MVSGKPAARAAARNSVAPPPGARTAPTAISSTREGSMPERWTSALKTPWRRSAAAVSLKPPLPPLVKGVRSAAVTTICSLASAFGPLEACNVVELGRVLHRRDASGAMPAFRLALRRSSDRRPAPGGPVLLGGQRAYGDSGITATWTWTYLPSYVRSGWPC